MSERYEVQGKIGQGGLGEVYLARDMQLDREVAIKRVKAPEDANLAQLEEDLFREAKTLSALMHPNIVTIFDAGRDEKGPFVVMELLKGETLDQVIDRGKLTVEDFKEVVIQVMEGMIAAQSRGLVHRDLKPGNIMINWLASGRFQAKILDFGLARFTKVARPQTQDQGEGIFGSIFFMAPEQFERLPLDARTDMYSLGCIFYQILSTKHPFDGETAMDVMVSHLQHLVVPLLELRDDMPRWMADWVMWLLSRDMEDRPADAQVALDAFMAGRLPHAPPEPVASVGPVVRVVGRGKGPGMNTQNVPRSPGGTAHAARSSRPMAHKVKKKGKLPWILAGLALAGGGGAYLMKKKPPEAPATAAMVSPVQLLERLSASATPRGDGGTVKALAGLATDAGLRGKVGEVLRKLQGDGVEDAVLAAYSQGSADQQGWLVEVLAARPSPKVLKVMAAAVGKTRGTALLGLLKALAKNGDTAQVDDLLMHVGVVTDVEERKQFFAVIGKLLAKEPDKGYRVRLLAPALEQADAGARALLLGMLANCNDPAANQALREEMTKGGERRKAALEILPRWVAADRTLVENLAAAVDSGDKELAGAVARLIAMEHSLTGPEALTRIRRLAELPLSARVKEEVHAALGMLSGAEALKVARELNASAAVEQITARLSHVVSVAPGSTQLDGARCSILGPGKDAYYSQTIRYISGWKQRSTELVWDLKTDAACEVELELEQSGAGKAPRELRISLGSTNKLVRSVPTASSEDFKLLQVSGMVVPAAGEWRLRIEALEAPEGEVILNLKQILLHRK